MAVFTKDNNFENIPKHSVSFGDRSFDYTIFTYGFGPEMLF